MINQPENSVAKQIEVQTQQTKTQSVFKKNNMFLVTILILAVGFALDLASMGADTLTTAILGFESMHIGNLEFDVKFGATSQTIVHVGSDQSITKKYNEVCKQDPDADACQLYHRGAAFLALRCVSLVVSLIAGGLIISLLINSSKVEALFKSKKNQYLAITLCVFVMALLQIISVLTWLIKSPIKEKEHTLNGHGIFGTDVKIGRSIAITFVTITFNLGCFASLLFMHIKKRFDL